MTPARWYLTGLLLLSCGLNILAETFLVSGFRTLLLTAFPGEAFPGITLFVFKGQAALIIMAVGWFFLGLWIIFRARLIWLLCLFFAVTFQVGTTWIALTLPLYPPINLMSAR
jgi:hypothetical protein